MCLRLIVVVLTALSTIPTHSSHAQAASTCASSDSAAAAAAVRARLAEWVAATNRGDGKTARDVWAPGVVGWFPSSPEFGDSAARTAAGVQRDTTSGSSTYELTIDDLVVSDRIAVVHDLWRETRHFSGTNSTARRLIRGSELWRCQPDGRWRIVRWVSAPERWERAP